MVSKFTISMPHELLDQVDEQAQSLGQTRSGLIREATAQYLERQRELDAAGERQMRVRVAITGMKAMAARPKRDPRPSLDVLRDLRAHDGLSTPGPGCDLDIDGGEDE